MWRNYKFEIVSVSLMFLCFIGIMLFLILDNGERPGPGSTNIRVDQFSVTEVGGCTGSRYSRCAYSVSNGVEHWNLSLARPMMKGWTVERTTWTSLMGNKHTAWK